jgi:WD40 repeat protein
MPGQFRKPIVSHTNSLYRASFSPRGDRILTIGRGGAVRVSDAFTGTPLWCRIDHRESAAQGQLRYSRDGRRLLVATSESAVQLLDAETGEHLGQGLHHDSLLRHAELSADARRVLTLTEDGAIQIWNEQGNAIGKAILTQADLASFSPDGDKIATIERLNETAAQAKIWNVTTGQPATPAMPINGPGGDNLSFSPDGNRLLTWTHFGAVRVWNANTGLPVTPVFGHDGAVVSAASFSPDGGRVLTAGSDRAARVWDADTGSLLVGPMIHKRNVSHAVFSSDGGWIATASSDHTARIWDAATGLPITPPLPHSGPVNYAEFARHNRRFLTACGDGTARVWDFSPTILPVDTLELLVQLLSSRTFAHPPGLAALSSQRLKETWEVFGRKYPGRYGQALR